MKKLSLLSLSLTLCVASANASIGSIFTIAKWKVMDALYAPSAETRKARVLAIENEAAQKLARLQAQLCTDVLGTLKEVDDLVAPYKNARYPYMLCIDYMFHAKKECDTQLQYLEYAKIESALKLSFETLRTNLVIACRDMVKNPHFQADLSASEQAERYAQEDDNFFLPRPSLKKKAFMKSPSLSAAHSSSDLASIPATSSTQEPESNDYHAMHPDKHQTHIAPW